MYVLIVRRQLLRSIPAVAMEAARHLVIVSPPLVMTILPIWVSFTCFKCLLNLQSYFIAILIRNRVILSYWIRSALKGTVNMQIANYFNFRYNIIFNRLYIIVMPPCFHAHMQKLIAYTLSNLAPILTTLACVRYIMAAMFYRSSMFGHVSCTLAACPCFYCRYCTSASHPVCCTTRLLYSVSSLRLLIKSFSPRDITFMEK